MTAGKAFVSVGGSIATGKSTLVDALGGALGLDTFPERWQENPWFGAAPPQTLASQMWFFVAAASDNVQIEGRGGGVQERSIHEHALVFAAELLEAKEGQLAMDTYALLRALVEPPTLLVFLHAPPEQLYERVRLRNRPQEADLTLERLVGLGERYEAFIEDWTLCPVLPLDTTLWDLRVESERAEVLRQIDARLS
jgi:deoxyadenosine/deoxycytidine kinase